MTLIVLTLILAYLLGSVPAGSWIAHARGVDIRSVGSGNIGATNVMRALGPGPAFLVALFDALKGVLAVLLARLLMDNPPIEALCGALAVLGHNFSVFLRFRGGKGVATSFGVFFTVDPLAGVVGAVIGFLTIYLTRFVSAGSMLASANVVLVALALQRPAWEVVIIAALTALLFWQHRENLKRLHAGNERRFGEKIAKA